MRALSVLVVAGACACGARSPSPLRGLESTPAENRADPKGVAAPPAVCEEEKKLTAPDRDLFERGRAFERAGDLHKARSVFAHLSRHYRGSQAILSCYNAATEKILAARKHVLSEFELTPVEKVAAPPYKYFLRTNAASTSELPPRTKAKLTFAGERKNKIVDENAWFDDNDIRLPLYQTPSRGDYAFMSLAIYTTENAPWPDFEVHGIATMDPEPQFLRQPLSSTIPLSFGALALERASVSNGHIIAWFGSDQVPPVLTVFTEKGAVVGNFDLTAFRHPPLSQEVKVKTGSLTVSQGDASVTRDLVAKVETISLELGWAEVLGDVLFVQHHFNGYTRVAGGQTGYLTAIRMSTREVLWRSEAQVANARSFLLDKERGVIVSAYGFTAEPRALYVIDATTGVIAQKLPVRATPSVLVRKDDTIYLRGYDTDYTLRWK